ncbi:MAG: threonine/serine transporter TdcC, partial [Enterobacter asburiae]|nr:threonine/serine transporter TdcC [Enterobacter asburiae]
GVVITFLYFFAICPLLWIYGVTITNTFMTFWENQLQLPALNRGVVALFLLLLMAFVIWFGKDLMVKVMSFLVFPFIASLVLISLSLIPYWNSAVIDQVNLSDIAFTGHDGILVTVWLGISIMVFSFNFSPIVSSFVVSKREEYEPEFGKEFTEQKCSKIPQNMADAKAQNIPVLSYLANHFASMSGTKSTFATVLEYGASIIALVAIFKSFFGHYLGTLEGLNGLILKFGYKGDKKKVSVGKLNTISMVFIMGSTWVVAYANPNILDLIEAMGAPIIASLLCLLPMYAIRKAPALAKYKGRTENIFVTAVGLLTILNIVYKLF